MSLTKIRKSNIEPSTRLPHTNAAFDTANSASSYANGSYGTANTANTLAQSAFNAANNNVGSINSLGNDIGNLINDISTTNSTLTTVGLYANGAFNAANNVVDTWVRDAANSASSYANAAYVQANTTVSASSYANAAYGQANTANTLAQAAYDAANNAVDTWVRDAANSASSYANGSFGTANSASSYANAAFDAANNAVDTWVRDAANSASSYANGAFAGANSASSYANGAFGTSNSASSYANAAFDAANNKFSSTGGTLNGDLNVTGNVTLNATTIFDANTARITNLGTPTSMNDAATKSYVDSVAEGLHIHAPCDAATSNTLTVLTGGTVTYDNGTAGVGATLTLQNALTVLDGYTLQNNDRVMVKNETNTAHNGIYTWATGGTVLTRATDYNTPTEMAGGDFVFVKNGTLYADTGWVQADAVITVGSGAVNFIQFSGAGTYTTGNGLQLNGTEFSISSELDNEISVIFNSANSASSYANGAFNAANTGAPDSWARSSANSASSYANGAFDSANSASSYANGSFTRANTADQRAVTSGTYANAAYVQANTTVSASSYANGAFGAANSASSYANGAFAGANTADQRAVTSGDYANSAYSRANTAPSTSTTNIFTAKQTFLGSGNDISIVSDNYAENVSIVAAAATGTINFEIGTYSVLYYTSNASGNQTLNFRISSTSTLNSQLEVGQSISVTFIVTNGATPFYPSAHQIDGSAVTPRWADGTAVTAGNANSTDIYSYSIIKTAATPTYILLANQTRFA